MNKGKLILIVGLPGSGKGTLIAHLRQTFSGLVFPISWTTRAIRPGEADGEVYHFATEQEFKRAVEAGEFLEWVVIDTGHKYGTLKKEILNPILEGKFVLREVEVGGARAIKKMLPPDELATIFINTDSWEDLRKRIVERAPISERELQARKERHERELKFKDEAQYVVENRQGKLEEAKQQLENIIRSIIHS